MKKTLSIVGGVAVAVASALLLLPSQPVKPIFLYIEAGSDYISRPPASGMDYTTFSHGIMSTFLASNTSPYWYNPGEAQGVYMPRVRAIRDSLHAHGGKILICLMGNEYFAGTADALNATIADSTRSQTLVNSMMALIRSENLDGVDIDLEYPAGNRSYALERFNRMFREQLDQMSPPGLLTWALYPLPGTVAGGEHAFSAKAITYIDYANTMWYEMGQYRGGETKLGFQDGPVFRPAPCYDAFVLDDSIHIGWYVGPKGYVHFGWPKNKIGIGVGLYGTTFTRTGTMPIEVCTARNTLGVLMNWKLEEMEPGGTYAAATKKYDPVAKTSYWQQQSGTTAQFISFANPEGLAAQMQWVNDNDYGAAMVWSAFYAYISTSGYTGDRNKWLRPISEHLWGDAPPVEPPPIDPPPVEPPCEPDTIRIRDTVYVTKPCPPCDTVKPPPIPGTGITVYTQTRLETPWINSGWTAQTSYSGTEIQSSVGPWGAVGFHYGNWGQEQIVLPANYSSIDFRIRSTVAGAVRVAIRNATESRAYDFTLPANSWATVRATYPSEIAFYDFYISNNTGTSKIFTIDDVVVAR
jgi:hypothetical protein